MISNPVLDLTLELNRAQNYLADELANMARPIIRSVLLPHAWSEDRQVVAKLTWFRAGWLSGRRGMILSRDGDPTLFAAIEAPAPGGEPPSGTLIFKVHCAPI